MPSAIPVSVSARSPSNTASLIEDDPAFRTSMRSPCAGSSMDSDLLSVHVGGVDTSDSDGLFHRVAAERVAEFLVEQHLDQRRGVVLHLILDRLIERVGERIHRLDLHALEAASLRDAGITHLLVKLGADEIIVEPQSRVTLFSAPLVVTEDDLRDRRPLLATDGGQLVDGDAKGAVPGKAHDGHVRLADLGADDRRQAIATGAEEAR